MRENLYVQFRIHASPWLACCAPPVPSFSEGLTAYRSGTVNCRTVTYVSNCGRTDSLGQTAESQTLWYGRMRLLLAFVAQFAYIRSRKKQIFLKKHLHFSECCAIICGLIENRGANLPFTIPERGELK